MTAPIGIQVDFVVLTPTDPSGVPNNSIFIDSTNGNTQTIKGPTGTTRVTEGGSLFNKQKTSSGIIALYAPVALMTDGSVVAADAKQIAQQDFIGYALTAAAASGDLLTVLLVGANITGLIGGLGFAPGDIIYVNEGGGYVNTTAGFTGTNDSIIQVGVADCAAGAPSTPATDLIIFPQLVAHD